MELELRIMGQPRTQLAEREVVVERNADVQKSFRFAPLHRQQPMRGDALRRLAMIEIGFELRPFDFLAAFDGGNDVPEVVCLLIEPAIQFHVFGPALRDDVAGALQRRVAIGDFLLRIDVGPQYVGA
jgi:hypothetical protein